MANTLPRTAPRSTTSAFTGGAITPPTPTPTPTPAPAAGPQPLPELPAAATPEPAQPCACAPSWIPWLIAAGAVAWAVYSSERNQ